MQINQESADFLFKASLKAIPFNIILAFILAIELSYEAMPSVWIGIWFLAICFVSSIRWFFCNWLLKKGLEVKKIKKSLIQFLILTFIMSVVWSFCYILAMAYLPKTHEFIIILVLGGMSAGAMASLSIWMPAYLAYILPMLLPVIVYNFSLWNVNRSILAVMVTLFIIMLVLSAKINNKMLNQVFQLGNEKEILINKLQVLSVTDVLTGLYNRRHFEEVMEREFNRGKRNKYAINLISIDIDNFKLINDTYGHPYGDKFLQYIATLLKKSFTRSEDTIFRLGGDEFAAIVANISMNEAFERCKKIKESFNQLSNFPDYHLLNQPDIFSKVTLSISLVYIPHDTTSSIANAIIAADKALYQSKHGGKNKIVIKKLRGSEKITDID